LESESQKSFTHETERETPKRKAEITMGIRSQEKWHRRWCKNMVGKDKQVVTRRWTYSSKASETVWKMTDYRLYQKLKKIQNG
jgi:hypothetical protein